MVFVECYADTALAVALGFNQKQIRHALGRGNVVRGLLKAGKGSAIVDEDPGQPRPSGLKRFKVVRQMDGLKLLADATEDGMRMAMLNPRLEDWLVGRVACCGFSMRAYGLPASGNLLHRSGRYDVKPGLGRLLHELSETDEQFQVIRQFLGDPQKAG